MEYYVKIIERETKEVVETMGPMPLSQAERVERGVQINLNRKEYYTTISRNKE